MDSTTMLPTARNSDCQFCRVRFQKSAEAAYPAQLTGSCRSASRCSLNALRPAMDCASQLKAKITPITMPNDREYRASRNPRVRAQPGESSPACSPTFCSLSDSVPCLPSGLDSGEPFCTNQTVAKMYRKNCRYSDCQFSATSTPKLEDVRYWPRVISCRPAVICWSLYSATPVNACPASAARKMIPKNR